MSLSPSETPPARPAFRDELTGLPTRDLLTEHLGLALARARRNGTEVALLSLDLDGFGLVNDALGRAAGDEVLRGTALRLAAVTRAPDVLARTGGDEFALLLADLDRGAAASAVVVGRLIRESLAPAFHAGGTDFHLGANIGVALFPVHASTADDLLRRAAVARTQARRR